ncbi:hypothetical protein [Deinococcus pimensis]|uniref:hypothetical protein n=1 Tax=Deinococcus pimensis TaxID=309888 RepID=UPI0004817F07|nr:hypothetical protein [Deinococcus pimensis]
MKFTLEMIERVEQHVGRPVLYLKPGVPTPPNGALLLGADESFTVTGVLRPADEGGGAVVRAVHWSHPKPTNYERW